MQAVGALAQAELGAAADHVQAVVNVHAHQVEQAEGLRPTIHERHIVDTEGVLERGVPIGRRARPRVEAVLDLDDEAQARGAVRSTTSEMPRALKPTPSDLSMTFRADYVRRPTRLRG